MSRAENLNRVLRKLQVESPDLEGCALISEDGLIIAGALPQQVQELRMAGICAMVLNLGLRTVRDLNRGALKQVLFKGEQGYVVMMTATQGTMLVVITTENARLGLVFLDMNQTIEELSAIL